MAGLLSRTKPVANYPGPLGLLDAQLVRAATQFFRQFQRRYDSDRLVPRREHFEASVDVTTLNPVTNFTQAQVGAFTVPGGMYFEFKWLVQLYVGPSAFTPGDGSVKFAWDIDDPLGSAPRQGYPLQGFFNSTLTLGGYNSGIYAPWELEEPEIIEENSILRSKVTVDGTKITAGRIVTIAGGHLWPRDP